MPSSTGRETAVGRDGSGLCSFPWWKLAFLQLGGGEEVGDSKRYGNARGGGTAEGRTRGLHSHPVRPSSTVSGAAAACDLIQAQACCPCCSSQRALAAMLSLARAACPGSTFWPCRRLEAQQGGEGAAECGGVMSGTALADAVMPSTAPAW